MRDSPFTLHHPVFGDDFFGRTGLLREVLLALQQGAPVNIFGLSRMGKSSLLSQVAHLCKVDPGWGGFVPYCADLYPGELRDRLAHALNIREDSERPDRIWRGIEHACRSQGKTLLLLDEAERLFYHPDAAEEAAQLRSLHQARALNFVVSTLNRSALDHLADDSPLRSRFETILRTIPVTSLLPEEATELIAENFRRGEAHIDQGMAAELARYVGYRPNEVQAIGAIAFDLHAGGEGLRAAADLPEITSRFQQEFMGRFWMPALHALLGDGATQRFGSLGDIPEEQVVTSLFANGFLLTDEGSTVIAPFLRDALPDMGAESLPHKVRQLASLSQTPRVSRLERTMEKALRYAFRNAPPTAEAEVQQYVDVILCAMGLTFTREGPALIFALRGYRPDHTIPTERLAIEVKLCRDRADLSRVVEEISADIMPYLTRYATVLFIIFDLGGIYDPDAFRTDFEKDPRVHVSIIKR